MAISTKILELPRNEWVTIPLEGSRTIISKNSGNVVKCRFGTGGEGSGLTLTEPMQVDADIEVNSLYGISTLIVANGD